MDLKRLEELAGIQNSSRALLDSAKELATKQLLAGREALNAAKMNSSDENSVEVAKIIATNMAAAFTGAK